MAEAAQSTVLDENAQAVNAEKLKRSCTEGHKLFPDNCSGNVRYIAGQMGYTLPSIDANSLVDYFNDATKGWKTVTEDEAQAAADAGELVIAGKRDTPNGHVVVVLPGGKTGTGGYEYEWFNKKEGKTQTLTMSNKGNYPRSCSTSKGSWPGATSNGDKSVWDSWAGKGYLGVQYWKAPAKAPPGAGAQ
jgi:hypothetical protein